MKKIIVLSIVFVIFCCGCANYKSDYTNYTNYSAATTTETIINNISDTTISGEKFAELKFVENITACPLNGNVSLNGNYIGETSNGIFRLSYTVFRNFSNDSIPDLCLKSIINCADFSSWKTTKCWSLRMDESFFSSQGRQVNLITIMNANDMHIPKNDFERTNFVNPDSVMDFINHQREIKAFTNDTYVDIEKIWLYMIGHFQYLYDSETSGRDSWQFPNETLQKQSGDCEDFSNLLTSLARAYNNSVKCYSLVLPDHVGTFCKIPFQNSISYGFYDNMDTPIRAFASASQNASGKLNEALTTYFYQYGLDQKNHKILSAFNDETYFNFENNEEFVKWAVEL